MLSSVKDEVMKTNRQGILITNKSYKTNISCNTSKIIESKLFSNFSRYLFYDIFLQFNLNICYLYSISNQFI